MQYLGIDPQKPKIAVFDFTSCEGCELQIANKEESLDHFLSLIEVVNFREVSSEKRQDYDIAFIEGSITREDEVERIKDIRSKAKILVALGSCACFGGVNRLKNNYDLDAANKEVYGDMPKPSLAVRSVSEVVEVDLQIPGCPVSKAEVERAVQQLVWGLSYIPPRYPVCIECKRRFTVCAYDRGLMCMGPITMAGCDAPCPAAGVGCWGCRGPTDDANFEEFCSMVREHGFSEEEIIERMGFFGGFEVKS